MLTKSQTPGGQPGAGGGERAINHCPYLTINLHDSQSPAHYYELARRFGVLAEIALRFRDLEARRRMLLAQGKALAAAWSARGRA